MKHLSILVGMAVIASLTAISAQAASLNGTKWNTVDDKTGQKKAVVQFTESDGVVSGKIIKVYDPAKADRVCVKCKGSLKDKPVVGLPIITGLKLKKDNEWDGGQLVDPESGKIYKGKATLSNDGKTLELRGYVGVSALGRSQTWQRVN